MARDPAATQRYARCLVNDREGVPGLRRRRRRAMVFVVRGPAIDVMIDGEGGLWLSAMRVMTPGTRPGGGRVVSRRGSEDKTMQG